MSVEIESVPVIAILRGVSPLEVAAVGGALAKCGVRGIEVPLNSPSALESIGRLSEACGGSCLCGAGTVIEAKQVQEVYAAGGRLIVSPNVNVEVIRRAVDLELTVLPGFATPSEAFAAIGAGARNLKLFPASTYGTRHLGALRSVLPAGIRIYAVGGVGVESMAEWWRAGIDGVGIGADLFVPGRTVEEVSERAGAIMRAVPR
jgi:2-dehydro-3-deoxyphosphogalactonate aldolase